MRVSLRWFYGFLVSMAVLFILSEGRDHRFDHLLRLRRRKLNRRKFSKPTNSFSPLNKALFKGKSSFGNTNDIQQKLKDISKNTFWIWECWGFLYLITVSLNSRFFGSLIYIFITMYSFFFLILGRYTGNGNLQQAFNDISDLKTIFEKYARAQWNAQRLL